MPKRSKRYRAIVRAVYETPWAILPAKLEQICELLQARTAGHVFTREEIAARIGTKPTPAQGGERVAVLNVFGVVCQRMGMMEEISGGVSTEALGRAVDAAAADPNVKAIVLNVDSPGGSCFGVQEVAAKIYRARETKRIVAVVNCLAASAAYWIASACNEIVCSPSGLAGSVGVLMVHRSIVAWEDKEGLKTTITRTPDTKAEGAEGEALTESAAAYRQHMVDQYYAAFVADVAKYRGIKPEKVKSDYGKGRVLVAQDAEAARLVDRIATLETVLSELGVGSQASGISAADEPAFTAEWLT